MHEDACFIIWCEDVRRMNRVVEGNGDLLGGGCWWVVYVSMVSDF